MRCCDTNVIRWRDGGGGGDWARRPTHSQTSDRQRVRERRCGVSHCAVGPLIVWCDFTRSKLLPPSPSRDSTCASVAWQRRADRTNGGRRDSTANSGRAAHDGHTSRSAAAAAPVSAATPPPASAQRQHQHIIRMSSYSGYECDGGLNTPTRDQWADQWHSEVTACAWGGGKKTKQQSTEISRWIKIGCIVLLLHAVRC